MWREGVVVGKPPPIDTSSDRSTAMLEDFYGASVSVFQMAGRVACVVFVW